MNKSAEICMLEFPDIILSYGQSDEYSFIFKRATTLYTRRSRFTIYFNLNLNLNLSTNPNLYYF